MYKQNPISQCLLRSVGGQHGVSALRLFSGCVTLVMIAACSGNSAPATQLAAKVNKQEISVHQVNQAVARAAANQTGMSAERLAALRTEVLERLVDQQLAVDRAIEQKLDRKPEVMLQIEASRREILARSYFEQLGSSVPQPGLSEARAYYTGHPQLFSERRIYKLHEIAIGNMEANLDQLRSFAPGHTIAEVEDWLKTQNIPFMSNVVVRAAEQIPLDVLNQLDKLNDGQIGVIDTPKSMLVLQRIATQPAPIDEATSLPAIQRYLQNRRLLETVEQDIIRLRSQATIAYLNEFSAHKPKPRTGNVPGQGPNASVMSGAEPAAASGTATVSGIASPAAPALSKEMPPLK